MIPLALLKYFFISLLFSICFSAKVSTFKAAMTTAADSICTYHMYFSNTSLMQVSCSDGSNGLMTRWGYSDISEMFPYVTAWDQSSWNSANCGKCIKITSRNLWKTIYVTAIDLCGPLGATHFDLAPPAFEELFGEEGMQRGSMSAEWEIEEDISKCKGNKG